MKVKLSFFSMLLAVMFVGCSKENSPAEYAVTVTASPGGTAVATIDGQPVTKAPAMAYIVLTATPDENHIFGKWSLDETISNNIMLDDEEANPLVVRMWYRDFGIKAEFIHTPEVQGGQWLNGIVWATCNVNTPGSFTTAPEKTGMFYQWNSRIGWSSTDPMYRTDGVTFEQVEEWSYHQNNDGIWEAEHDPCPEGWQIPRPTDFNALLDDKRVTNEWIPATTDSPAGQKFTDKRTGNSIFFPAVGLRFGILAGNYNCGELGHFGSIGYYWSASMSPFAMQLDSDRGVTFYGNYVTESASLSVRCIAK